MVIWKEIRIFGYQVACCTICERPLQRVRDEETQAPGFYCLLCQTVMLVDIGAVRFFRDTLSDEQFRRWVASNEYKPAYPPVH